MTDLGKWLAPENVEVVYQKNLETTNPVSWTAVLGDSILTPKMGLQVNFEP